MDPKNVNRRRFLGALGAGSTLCPRPVSGARREPPNIVFLLTDDLRADCLGAAGNRIIRTPNVDRMAQDGVLFTNHFCSTSICTSSRASIFTGLHTRCHGVSLFEHQLRPADFASSYPALLRAAGYRTGFIGKYGVGPVLPTGSYDYFRGFAGQGHYFPPSKAKPTHLTRLMGDQALEFLEGCRAGTPFCLSISFKAPHVQDEDPRQYLYDPAQEDLYRDVKIPVPKTATKEHYQNAPEFIRNSEGHTRWARLFNTEERFQEMVKGYYRLITGVDIQIGRIRDALAARGLAGNTVLLFSSDNGFFLGERQLSHKFLMYEESIRVPLVVYDPRLAGRHRGRRRAEMTLNIDLAPTMLELAGVPRPPAMQGRSLLPLLEGGRPRWRREWYYEHVFTYGGRIPRSDGVRTERWKYIRYRDTQPLYEELYDLRSDPLEERNLVREPKFASIAERLRKRRQVWSEALDGWDRNRRWVDPD